MQGLILLMTKAKSEIVLGPSASYLDSLLPQDPSNVTSLRHLGLPIRRFPNLPQQILHEFFRY
jgi:hypothetical protein